jgi:uncharacterized protein (TIGR02284 family)
VNNVHSVKLLNSLIETTLDSANGYKEAAETTKKLRFKTMFGECSRKRLALAGRLQDEVRSGEPEDEQTATAAQNPKCEEISTCIAAF